MRKLAVAALVGCAASCLNAPGRECADGRLCPPGTQCDDDHQLCVVPAQLTACREGAEGETCEFSGVPGLCRDGVCVREGCGDGFARDSEQCDGDDLRGMDDCTDHGFHQPGPVTCTDSCTFNTSACSSYCGDGILDPPEMCDGAALGTVDGAPVSCRTLGFYNEAGLACSSICRYDVSGCTGFCGDGMVNGGELCDGADPVGITCLDFARDRGVLHCSGVCAADASGCADIGWHRDPVPSPGNVRALWGTSPADVSALSGTTDGPVLWRFDGAVWTSSLLTSIPPPAGVTDTSGMLVPYGAWRAPDGTVFVAGFYASSDPFTPEIVTYDGASWATASLPDGSILYDVHGVASDDVYAVGHNQILHYDGVDWSEVYSPSGNLFGVWAAGNNDVHAVGDTGAYHYDGNGWTQLSTVSLSAVWGQAGDDVWAVGAGGAILHYDGNAWTAYQDSPVSADLKALYGFADEVFAAGDGGVVLRYAGARWSRLVTDTAATILDLWGTGVSDMHAGAVGQILRYGGDTWFEPTAPATTDAISDLWVGTGGERAVAGKDVWTFDGGQWTAAGLPSPAFGVYEELWASGPADIYATGGDLWHYDGCSWTLTHPGFVVGALWAAAEGDVFVGGPGGALARGSGGNCVDPESWAPMSSGTSEYIDSLWGSSANDVFAVGAAGTILHFDGTTWSSMDSPTAAFLIDLDGTAADDVWAVGEAGTILHFDGADWSAATSPTGERLNRVVALSGEAFAAGANDTLLHFDGTRWSRVRSPATASWLALYAHGAEIDLASDQGELFALHRDAPW